MSIKQLPDHVVDKLRSSVTITSLNSVVLGLLRNSLDAGASKVEITVDYSRGNCTVQDDGIGIPSDEFQEGGGLGKPHRTWPHPLPYTSRFPPREAIFGRHGRFLAALANLSLLSVTSCHGSDASYNSLLLHRSRILARHLPALPEQTAMLSDHGTRVVVHNLFGSMPVRVKHRAVISADRSGTDKEWRRLVADAVATMLSWNAAAMISLCEVGSQNSVRLRSPDGPDLTLRTSRLLTQASLADAYPLSSWIPISASAGHITVRGCIATTPVSTRRAQFISIGIHPLPNECGTDAIFQEVNKVFRNSSFGAIDERVPDVQTVGKDMKSRKGVERWPMFYFRVRIRDCSPVNDADDILDGQANQLERILDLLKAVCYGFLEKQHLRPQRIHMSRNDEPPLSTSKSLGRPKTFREGRSHLSGGLPSRSSPLGAGESSRVRSDSPFDSWQRIKVGHAAKTSGGQKGRPHDTAPSEAPRYGRLAQLRGEDVGGAEETSPYFGGRLSLACRGGDSEASRKNEEQSAWLKEVLQSGETPAFDNVPRAVPRAYDDPAVPCNHPHAAGQATFESRSVNMNGRISKAALADAVVVGQVDRKFILVKLLLDGGAEGVSGREPSALVMLDQHAVDERCKLEELMGDYFVQSRTGRCTARTEALERPLTFEIGLREADSLEGSRQHLNAWGVSYHLSSRRTAAAASRGRSRSRQIAVTSLPPSVLERCRAEPRLVIDLLREESRKLAEDEGALPASQAGDPRDEGDEGDEDDGGGEEDRGWPGRFHGCPSGILELLRARACRSAVMFQDVLTHGECEELVRRVAKCAFPFQCAHGRPSMAPLVDLGEIGSSDEPGLET
ncbi:DNA mismatch repair protein MLH3 [Geosmithia morbida]|uniref:DNA mismatch repair protein MLH3 n=1 Tax=Geosmithia morbida TaxID=1094350 RepID=A0A9P4YPM3_9HYPO|nr:DNA mismatch repair protein MLH3 [Geosmithia morbida]KAF4119497.1 DNA mismatch repair protein MLH3 [Geosmithia morbida]